MEITFDFPDWTDERNIYIVAGRECVYKRELGIWYKKVIRCSYCGECCRNVPDGWSHGKGKDGNCQWLLYRANQWICNNNNIPFFCCVSEGLPEYCDIEWEKIK